MDRVRIDRWLWAARFFKTRGLAHDAIVGGHVRVNGERVKPAREVRADDVLEVRVGDVVRTVVVLGVAERRGPAKVAATLYQETAESLAARARRAEERRLEPAFGDHRIGGRPTKLDRRRTDSLRGRRPRR
ncbi:MAG TPA: RNA-binding S4 domain-containing protein [Gaiellales bacterium]|nr:RNA-binding S4 domain-containing protein [Gaiellales bacterium]